MREENLNVSTLFMSVLLIVTLSGCANSSKNTHNNANYINNDTYSKSISKLIVNSEKEFRINNRVIQYSDKGK